MSSRKKNTIKKVKQQYQKIQIFFVGIVSLIILAVSINITQQITNSDSKGTVLSENVQNLFPSKQVGGNANTNTAQPSPSPINTNNTVVIVTPATNTITNTNPNGNNNVNANTNVNTNTLIPTPTLYCVGSIGGVCPTLTPLQGANQAANVNTVTNNGNTNCAGGNIFMQLLSDLISFFNALFGLNISLPNVGCSTVATNTNTVINTTNINGNTTTTNVVTPIPVVTYAIPVAPVVPSVAALTQGPLAVTQAPAPVTNITVFPQQDQLGNWAGYIYNLPAGLTGATLRSTWNVSQVTCGQDGNYAPWIGFGGSSQNDPNIAQLGVDFQCMNGQPSYATWTEAFPADSIYYNNKPVSVGDQMSENITFQGNGTFMTNIMNNTKGWSLSLPMSFGSGYTPQSGEVVSELVFGTVPPYNPPTSFTNNFFSNNGQVEQPLVTASGLVRVDLTLPTNKVALTQTSALTPNGFTVSFK